jgi:hypothetical protein
MFSLEGSKILDCKTGSHPGYVKRLRANDTVLIGDLLIWVKGAAEESRSTGMSFEDALVAYIVDDLA